MIKAIIIVNLLLVLMIIGVLIDWFKNVKEEKEVKVQLRSNEDILNK